MLAANWKMNKTVSEAREFVNAFALAVTDITDVEIIIAPPFTSLMAVGEALKGTNIRLSAQNVFYEEKGAYTGDISPVMLKDVGCEYVIIGHSERRQYFLETDDIVNRKIKASLKHGLNIIFCIGETLEEREKGRTFDVLKTQVTNGLKDTDSENLVVAYEPVWAIGTGRTATPDQVQEAHKFIREELRKLFGANADSIRILYGGSVTPENIDSLMSCPDVDGGLVGGASLKSDSFEKLVRFNRRIK